MRPPYAIEGRFLSRIMSVLTLATFLALIGGCAPKTVVPPAEVVPPPAKTTPRSVSEILLEQYEKWKGISYRWGGSSQAGVDCSGLVQAVFRDGFGLELPRTSIEQSRAGQPVPREAIRPGDLLFFSDRKTDHIGVAVDSNRFLQASTSAGVTVSELQKYWLPKLARVSRVLDDNIYTAGLQTDQPVR